MTRKEKEQRIQKQDGKVFENFSVEIRPTYLNPTYTLSDQTANEISPTGLLKVFELNSSGDGPSFTARWDGGNRSGGSERYELDMDIHGVSDQERIRFKHGLGGYSGHHTTKLESNKGHAYQVSLKTPNELIFEGTVCFNLLRKHGFEASIQFRATLETKLIRSEG
jgi:hypothetical protein